MGINQDMLLTIKAQLCERIEQIADQVGHIAPGKLAFEIDDIRRIARDYGMAPLAEIAHGLESAMARSEGAITVLPFLDSMRDAIGCDRIDCNAAQTYLAMVNQRLCG
jgi:hypothetical protein